MANPGEPPTGQPVIDWRLMCDKLGAQISQLENENHGLQRKLGILEKETSGFVNELLGTCSPKAGDIIKADIRMNYTAIATLLEQP